MAFGDNRPSVLIDIPDGAIPPGTTSPSAISGIPRSDPEEFGASDVFLELTYSQPDIEVDTSGRFATHEVIGDTTVRQKLGDSPAEISITGVCTEEEANRVDVLSNYDYVEVVSSRWEGTAQVASANTSPLSSGGTQNASEEWLHDFTIELSEVDVV